MKKEEFIKNLQSIGFEPREEISRIYTKELDKGILYVQLMEDNQVEIRYKDCMIGWPLIRTYEDACEILNIIL